MSDLEERRDAILVLWGIELGGYIPNWIKLRAQEAVAHFDKTGEVLPKPTPTSDQLLAMTLAGHQKYFKDGYHYCSCGSLRLFYHEEDFEAHLVEVIRSAGWGPQDKEH